MLDSIEKNGKYTISLELSNVSPTFHLHFNLGIGPSDWMHILYGVNPRRLLVLQVLNLVMLLPLLKPQCCVHKSNRVESNSTSTCNLKSAMGVALLFGLMIEL